jgi:crotonobetainyl-CoA hydratase
MMTNPILTERRGAVLEVTIDRPKANAIDAATSRIMGDVFAQFRDDPELRVAIPPQRARNSSVPAGI